MKSNEQFIAEDKLISWDTESVAVESTLTAMCGCCKQSIDYSIASQGLGSMVDSANEAVQQHIQKLEEYYHATGYQIPVVCGSLHNNSLLIVFGETQPARYVLVMAGVLFTPES